VTKKRPYKAGQTLWVVWSQLDAAGQHEVVVKPLVIVSCRPDVDPDYYTTDWETTIRFYPKFEHDIVAMETVTSLTGMLTFKTRRKAQRIKDDWDLNRKKLKAELMFIASLGSIREVF
jgi:hypothetical protein